MVYNIVPYLIWIFDCSVQTDHIYLWLLYFIIPGTLSETVIELSETVMIKHTAITMTPDFLNRYYKLSYFL